MKLRLIACAAMVFARAYAQEAPPVVQVKASADTQRRDDTASRIVINREEILRHGDTSAVDVMKRLPGVTIAGSGPRLRGLGAGYTQLLVNGERPLPGFSLEALSPDMIERIEIMRATTAEFSAQAVAGTINIVLRKAGGKPSREWKATLGIPAHFTARAATLALSDKDDAFAYTFNASLTSLVNQRSLSDTTEILDADGKPIARRHEDGESWARGIILNINKRLAWTLAEGETLSWNTFGIANFFRFDRNTEASVELGPPYPYRHSGYWRRDVDGSVRTEAAWSRKWENGAALNASISLNGGRGQRDRRYAAGSPQGDPLLARRYDTDPDSSGGASTGKFTWPAFNSHTFSAGWDAARSSQREHEVQTDTLAIDAGVIDFDRSSDARLRRLAMYAQDEWEVGRGLALYGGLRRESSGTRTAGSDVATTSTSMSFTSPTLQALWKIQGEPRRQLRAAIAASYKAPELRQLAPRRFLSLVNTEVTPDAIGNPDLRPETARGIDLSYEAFGKDGELFSLSAGTRRIRNVILDLVRFDDGRWVSAPANNGKARTHSLEMELKRPLAGAPWKYSLNVARYWSEVDAMPGPNNRLARQPRWSATIGTEYRSGPWDAGATLAATGAGWSRVSQSQSAYTGGQRDLSSYISYRPDQLSVLRFSVADMLRHPSREGSAYQEANGGTRMQSRERSGARLYANYSRQF